MEFIKTIGGKHGGKTKKFSNGYILLSENRIKIKFYIKDKDFDSVGFIKDGIGVNLSNTTTIKKCTLNTVRNLYKDDLDNIPNNLKAKNYEFYIPAEKLSDNEYIFKFDEAVMKKIKK